MIVAIVGIIFGGFIYEWEEDYLVIAISVAIFGGVIFEERIIRAF